MKELMELIAVLILWFAGCAIYLIRTFPPFDWEEFHQQFPGRCPICSFHEYGWKEGYEKNRTPRQHVCIEHGSRIWPVEGAPITSTK